MEWEERGREGGRRRRKGKEGRAREGELKQKQMKACMCPEGQ